MKTLILLLFITLSLSGYSKDKHLMFAAPKHSHNRLFSNTKFNLKKTFKYKARRHQNRVNQLYYQYEHSNPKRISAYENWNRRPKCRTFFKLF